MANLLSQIASGNQGKQADPIGSFQQGFGAGQQVLQAPFKQKTLEANTQDAQLTAASNKLAAIGNLLPSVKDQNSYSMAKQQLVAAGIINPQDIPDQYDPAFVDMHKNSLLNAKAQLDRQFKIAEINKMTAGGDSGTLLNRLNAQTPEGEALRNTYFGKVNANKGLEKDPITGQVINSPGYNEASANTKGAETGAGKKAEISATQAGEANKIFDVMHSNLSSVLQRFKEMRDASNDASYGFWANDEGTGLPQQFAKSYFGNDATSRANALLKQRSAQGILPELGPQLAQAGVRGNKFLETLANSASGLDLAAKPQDKIALVNGLENTYINNLKSTAAQLREKGQNAPSDKEIDDIVEKIRSGDVPQGMPTPTQNLSESEKAAAQLEAKYPEEKISTGNSILSGPKLGTIKNGYIFLGGNPANQKSWKKK